MAFYLGKSGRENTDLLITPNVEGITWTDFSNYKHLIRQGEKAAVSKISEIHKVLAHPFRKKMFLWPKNMVGKLKHRNNRLLGNVNANDTFGSGEK